MTSLQGKTAIVTGGAVGIRIAESFLSAGTNVALVFRNASRKKSVDENFARFPHSFLSINVDLSDHGAANQATAATKARFGSVDFLLNALGGWLGGKKLHEHTNDELDEMLSMDLVPTFNIMAAVIPVMVEQHFGRIVNFISLQVFGTGKGNSVYVASKSAVLALTKAAAEEYKNSGIAVYAVAPLTIDTESNRKGMPGADTSKWVTIDEIVDSLFFLCGAGDSSNGTVIKFPGKL